MSFTVKVEASAGSDWANLIKEAYDLTRKLGVNIEFPFNGLEVSVFRNGNVLVNQGNTKYVDFTVHNIPEYPPYPNKSNKVK
jgi:hypothetical protein